MKAIQLALALAPLALSQSDCGGCFCIPDNGGTGDCPDWTPQQDFPSELIEGFLAKKLTNPWGPLTCNPYEDEGCQTNPPQVLVDNADAVCAFKYSTSDCEEYGMITYESEGAASADGAFVTHLHACGLCSTAQDLAVYMANPDMTSAGKKCATKALVSKKWGQTCYENLGYTKPCATIWNFDGIYDGQNCKWVCMKNLFADLNGPPPACEMNACLQCDEDMAGPLFKAFAARTRRRSGLTSAIARTCDEFANLKHEACPAVVSGVEVT